MPHRLALRALRGAGRRRRGPDPHRGHRGHPRGPDQPRTTWASGTTGRPRRSRRITALPQRPGHRRRRPARARRAEGVDRPALERRRAVGAGRATRWQPVGAEPGAVRRGLPGAGRADASSGSPRSSRQFAAAARRALARRVRGRRDPRRPRLPDRRVPLPALATTAPTATAARSRTGSGFALEVVDAVRAVWPRRPAAVLPRLGHRLAGRTAAGPPTRPSASPRNCSPAASTCSTSPPAATPPACGSRSAPATRCRSPRG